MPDHVLTRACRQRSGPARLGIALVAAAGLVLAACGSSGSPPAQAASGSSGTSGPSATSGGKAASGGKAVSGATATLAESPQGTPNYIFPFLGPTTISNANVDDFNALMYLPLYWFGGSNGNNSSVALNTAESLAFPPVYSNGNRTVTIKIKPYKWSDGTPVTSASLIFFMDLAKANKADWGLYEPGHLPDNVAKFSAHGANEVVFNLTTAVNPTWFTANQLSELTPMPQQAWDKTSVSGKAGDFASTTKGAQAVYHFLSAQAAKTATYATNPLWKVVDGPWKLHSFDSVGNLAFVPNSAYSGPDKPRLSEFKEAPFTADSAEFNALLAKNEVDVGYLPTEDLSQQARLSGNGYQAVKSELYQLNFMVLNYHNPSVGPIVQQLYARQALQHVMDEQGQLKALLGNGAGGYADYGPIPPKPATSYLTSADASDLYPFSISAARSLLTSHGWKIPSSGPAVCTSPGSGPHNCGAGVPAGKKLTFTLLYVSGSTYLQQEMEVYKSDAARAGIVVSLSSAPFNTVTSRVIGTCPTVSKSSACSWQIGNWGAGFSASIDAYPSGELIFPNLTGFADSTLIKLINDTVQSSSPSVLANYAAYVSKMAPVIWQVNTYDLNEVATDLHGVTFDAIGNINPSQWYFSKS
jgi:peptide/nickel transport system substrate-binding protein